MSKPKKKPVTPHIVLASEAALIGAINRHAELALELKGMDAAHQQTVAEINSEHALATQAMRDELARTESSIHLYSTTHRADLFPGERKSKEYDNATIGFRLSPPSVATLLPKESQETVAMRLDALEWGGDYVKWTVKLDKETILRDRLTLSPAQLAQAGLTFKQDETFFIEPTAKAAERVSKPAEGAA